MDSFKVGIIGVGGVSASHYKGYVAAGAEVVAIADINTAALERRQREWRVPRSYTSAEELVLDPEVQAVSICLPNAFHHPATLAAAAVSKHVLCEKPISLRVQQGEEMISACRQAGVVLQIGHHLRSNSAAAFAKQLISEGRLGRLAFIRLRQAHDWGGERVVRDSFGKLANSGGGTLLDNGCHMMDLARYFGGDVAEVYARIATLGFAVEVEDTSLVSLTFASGALGSVENAWTATGWEEAFWIYGTQGALEYTNRFGEPVLRHSFRSSLGASSGEPDVATYRFAGHSAHQRSVAAFLAAIRGQQAVICSGEDGLEAVRLVMAGYESARLRHPVSLGPPAVSEVL
jgi:predicted dehydrogenase